MINLSDRLSAFLDQTVVCVPFFSESEFSMHQVVEWLLEQSGPAHVSISSFSISEIALRSFLRLHEAGLLQNLQCLLDISVKRHRLGLLFFAANFITGIGLAKNHAKIVLIENEHCRWLVVGSANLNLNDKNEAGILSRDPVLFGFFQEQFQKCFDKSMKVTGDEFN